MSKLPSFLLDHTLWETNIDPIWLASTLVLERNYASYPFPYKLSESEAKKNLTFIRDILLKDSIFREPTFLDFAELEPSDKEYIFEHFLREEGFHHAIEGQGAILDETCTCLILINMENHITLHFVDPTNDWMNSWDKLQKIEASLSKGLNFAFHPQFGYLTANPSRCGTALSCLTYLHMPALVQSDKIESLLETELEPDVELKPITANQQHFIGDLVILQNKYTLGCTEDSILHTLTTSANKLIQLEKNEREKIKESKDILIKDKIARAFGLLKHSFQIETIESLEALSLIKLGIELGWIKGIEHHEINSTFFRCRRAHLLLSEEKKVALEDLPKKRADLFHSYLKAMELCV